MCTGGSRGRQYSAAHEQRSAHTASHFLTHAMLHTRGNPTKGPTHLQHHTEGQGHENGAFQRVGKVLHVFAAVAARGPHPSEAPEVEVDGKEGAPDAHEACGESSMNSKVEVSGKR